MAAAVPIAIAAAVVSAGASIYGGIQANKSAKQEASLQQEQGRIKDEEANVEATSRARDVRRFAASQSLAFLSNGVTLAGSPLLTLEDTETQGATEVASIRRMGAAEARLSNQRAKITRNQGRAALIGGIGQAAGTIATTGLSVGAGATPKAGLPKRSLPTTGR